MPKPVELRSGDIAAFLSHDAGVQSALVANAHRVASAAGEGFRVAQPKQMGYGGGRVGVGVYGATESARRREATDKVLTRAVSSCRS